MLVMNLFPQIEVRPQLSWFYRIGHESEIARIQLLE